MKIYLDNGLYWCTGWIRNKLVAGFGFSFSEAIDSAFEEDEGQINTPLTCPDCLGTGEVDTMEPVYPGEPHMAPIGTAPCHCQADAHEED